MAGDPNRIAAVNKPCVLLIVISGIERFAFKGVASNLVNYLTERVKMSNSSAAKMVNNWVGFTYMLPLFVAPLAESFFDRYTIIQASSFIYALGLCMLTSTARGWPFSFMNMKKVGSFPFLCISLFLISLGQGGYNPSLQAFGAEQLDDDDVKEPNTIKTDDDDVKEPNTIKTDDDCSKKRWFFQWWYFGVCCGCLLGVSVMSYIQERLGWGLGFAIPTLALFSSIAFFTGGSRFYRYKHTSNTNWKCLVNKIQALRASTSRMMRRRIKLDGNSRKLELVAQGVEDNDHQDHERLGSSYENSENGKGLNRIAEAVLPLLPLWFVLLMFAVIFQQPATFFTKQGMTMERNIGKNFKIPPAALQSAITLSIILLLPLYDVVFIPIARIVTRNEKGINVMQRMEIGMFLSIVAMVFAALTERKRLQLGRNTNVSETVPMSIFWLLPQYILLGISDIFTVVGMQEFFFSEVPENMKTLGIALNTSVFGLGSFLSAGLISLVEYITSTNGGKSWFSDNMSNSRLDYFYWLLSITSAVSLLMFVIFGTFYKSK